HKTSVGEPMFSGIQIISKSVSDKKVSFSAGKSLRIHSGVRNSSGRPRWRWCPQFVHQLGKLDSPPAEPMNFARLPQWRMGHREHVKAQLLICKRADSLCNASNRRVETRKPRRKIR